MLLKRRASRALPIITGLASGVVLLHVAFAADAPRGGGIAALADRTPVVGALSAPTPTLAGDPDQIQDCSGTTVDRCFETGTVRQVNVGAFFDRRRQTASTHFFLKYFEPPATGRHRIDGFNFTCNRSGITFPACGVVRTSRSEPTFPTSDDLLRLQRVLVASAGANVATCVDLASSAVVLEEGQAAWIVLQFPDPPDTSFVAVAADGDANDHPCDFLTRDGDLWFRPDPRQSPLDWAFTVYHSPTSAKQEKRVPWTAIKNLVR